MSTMDWVALIAGIVTILVGVVTIILEIVRTRSGRDRSPKTRPIKPAKWLKRKKPEIVQYLHRELNEISSSITPGSTRLRVQDLLRGDDVFIPPAWSFYDPAAALAPAPAQLETLEQFLLAKIAAGERVLVLGDPGQGKSTLLKRIFYTLAHAFEQDHNSRIPVYIPCRNLDLDQAGDGSLQGLYRYLQSGMNALPVTGEEFRQAVENQCFIFLFDGLDEIRGGMDQETINTRSSSEIFLNPGLLSCRIHFYEIHLAYSPVDYKFPTKVQLQSLDDQAIERYVSNVCTKLSLPSSDRIIASIHQDPKLADLSRRLLLLVMITDILSRHRGKKNSDWSTVKLYEDYTGSWLRNEARKSTLSWFNKDRLLELIAWESFTAKLPSTLAYGESQKITINRAELRDLFARLDLDEELELPLNDIVDDVCSFTLLDHTGDDYHFVHRSFQEYYVARYFFHKIKDNLPGALAVLRWPLPVEIATFLKEMLTPHRLPPNDIELITNNLLAAYHDARAAEDEAAVTIREQAGYFLSRMKTGRAARILEQIAATEQNKFVQRGIIIGLIYTYKRQNYVDAYLDILHNDPEADAINIGYHLEYYGDQAPQGDHRDKQGPRCERTVAAILRHLKNPDEHCIGWALDFLTLRRLLETRGLSLTPCLADELPFLQKTLAPSPQDRASLAREKSLLTQTLEELELL